MPFATPIHGDYRQMSRLDLVPANAPAYTLRQALYRAGRDFRGGITALAPTMAMPYDELQKKLNVDNTERHLDPEEIEDLLRLTQSEPVLDALGRAAGVVWYRKQPVEASPDAIRALGKFIEREGKFVESLADGVADGRWDQGEVEQLESHGYKLIAKLLGIMAGARDAMEGRSDD